MFDCLIDGRELQQAYLFINSIIYALAWGEGEVTYQPPFPGLALLGDYPETANVDIGDLPLLKWARHPASCTFRLQVLMVLTFDLLIGTGL